MLKFNRKKLETLKDEHRVAGAALRELNEQRHLAHQNFRSCKSSVDRFRNTHHVKTELPLEMETQLAKAKEEFDRIDRLTWEASERSQKLGRLIGKCNEFIDDHLAKGALT